MSGLDRLLVACPSCSAWPMPVRVRTPQRAGDGCGLSFGCIKCGHREGGSIKSKSRPSLTRKQGLRGREDRAPNVEKFLA
jgi:hypothetical protein